MALIKCPECGHDVSTLADRCQNCGFPLKDLASEKENSQKIEAEVEEKTEPVANSNKSKAPIVVFILLLLAAASIFIFSVTRDVKKVKYESSPYSYSSFQTHDDDAVTGIKCEVCGQRDAIITYGGYDMCKYCYEFVKYGKK